MTGWRSASSSPPDAGSTSYPAGRVLMVGPPHTFADLADAVNAAFARCDLAHLHAFRLSDGRRIGYADEERRTRLPLMRGQPLVN